MPSRTRAPLTRRIPRAVGVTLAALTLTVQAMAAPPTKPKDAPKADVPKTDAPKSDAPKAGADRLGESPEPAVREMTAEMRAESLFQAGQRKFDAGDFKAACADFQESLRIGPKLGTLLNLALCHENVGRLATAWTEYLHGAAWAAQNGQKDRYDFAIERAALLGPRLPRVTLQLPTSRTIATLELDGEPLPEPRWYLPIFVDAGEHHVAVSAPGKKRVTVSFSARAGHEQLVPIANPPDDEAHEPAPPQEDGSRELRRVMGLGMMGVGIAGVGVGVFFGARAISLSGDVSSACAGGCGPEQASRSDDAKAAATLATVSLAAGAVLAGAGAYLFASSAKAPAPLGAVRASIGPGVGAVGVGGVF